MRYVGLRRRPALAGANGMQTRQARVLWNVRALGNALGVRGGLQGRVLYVKDIWKVKSLDYDSLRFSVIFGVTPIILFEYFNDIIRTKRRCQQKDLQSLHTVYTCVLF